MIIRAGSEQKWNKNTMVIMCNFNMNCNFKCSYCINQSTRKNYTEQLSKEALYNLFSNLPKLNKELYNVILAGGEPSLYQYFPEMVQYLNDFLPHDKCTFTITTNGSLLHKLEEYFTPYENLNFRLAISMHLEQMDAETYLKKFSKFKYPDRCQIIFMLEPKTLDKINAVIEKAKRFGYTNFLVKPITIKQKLHPDYSEEEKNFIENNPYASKGKVFNEYKEENQIIKKDVSKTEFTLNPELVNYSGMHCLAGASSMRVLSNGTISPCHWIKAAPDFNLNTHSFLEYEYLHKPVICPSSSCECIPFTALPKWNSEFAEGPDYFNETNISQ